VRTLDRLDKLYRHTGANLPFGDPRPSHGAEMEGYFWRVTDVDSKSVLVILCGINRHPDGDWATVAVAAHPGGFVRSTVLPNASASSNDFLVQAGDGAFKGTETEVHVDLGADTKVDLSLSQGVTWPRVLGGGGVFSAIPYLGQYWHPHLLGGSVAGKACVGQDEWEFIDAAIYAEKNWGAGFPERWWWGQAQGFNRSDVCVAFSGGVLTAGPLSATVGGVIVRVGAHLIRLTPPLSRVHSETDGRHWEVRAHGHGYRVHIIGTAENEPHALPVPLLTERRNIHTDFEHLAGQLSLDVSGRLNYQGDTALAGLEIGHRPSSGDERI